MKHRPAAFGMHGICTVAIQRDAHQVHDQQNLAGIDINPSRSDPSNVVRWSGNKTIADIERNAFIAGQTGFVDLIVRCEAELMEGTLSVAETEALGRQLEEAMGRADALSEAFGQVVLALRTAGCLGNAEALGLAAVLEDVLRHPEADLRDRIDMACGLAA